jgi:hypothetical protein
MFSSRLAVVGAVLVAGTVPAGPAAASVTYDPRAMTGFVGGSNVRHAFGWSEATLASRASGLVFDHEFWTDDNYTVACGGPGFPVVHHREFGRFELTDVASRGGRSGYDGELLGFRLAGAHSGISGTSVPPMAGQPCPECQGPRSTIDRADLVSSTTGWALYVSSGDLRHELLGPRDGS